MTNATKGNALYINSMVYSGLTAILTILALTTKDVNYLKFAGATALLMCTSLGTSYIFVTRDAEQPIIIVAIGFISLFPLAMFIYIITTIVSLFGKLIRPGGGDNDD